jgi:hypothetical protein
MPNQNKDNQGQEQVVHGRVDEKMTDKQKEKFGELMKESFPEPGKIPGGVPKDDEKIAREALRYDERREEESYRGPKER